MSFLFMSKNKSTTWVSSSRSIGNALKKYFQNSHKMKKQPQTIADLKINWIFKPKYKGIDIGRETFKSLNPSLNYKIKKDWYTFVVSDCNFSVKLGEYDNNSIDSFIEQVDYEFRQTHTNLNLKFDENLTLIKFKLIFKNTFEIHTKP